MSKTKLTLFALAAFVAAAIFVRLGFWQLSRLHQRRALNALVSARLSSPPVDVRTVEGDTAAAHYRRVSVSGSPDYDHELIWAARTHNGAPGVNLLTPIRLPGSDTAVLVDRGWVYSPDGATIDEAKWRDRDSTFVGYVEELPTRGGAEYTSRERTIARLGRDALSKTIPYPVAPIFVIALGDTTGAGGQVVRLTVPPLDEGPHLSYAIQWFSFAVVTLVGLGIVFRQALSERAAGGAGVVRE